MIKRLFFIIVCIIFSNYIKAQTDFVNVFIGTGGHGHTFPGATVPFGMVQLSPDTDIQGWDWCSGYHSSDSSIMGFSHTHLSGTGAADYGDIMVMPTFGKINYQPGRKSNPAEGYRSRFSHKKEKAEPGYYSVYLDDYLTQVELTTTERCGFHKYTFYQSGQMNLIVDLEHGIHDKVKEGYIKIVSNNKIIGYRNSGGWAKDHTVFFVAEFSKPFLSVQLFDGKNILHKNELKNKIVKAAISFNVNKLEQLTIKVGISPVSIEGAQKNYNAEVKEKSFNDVKISAAKKWEDELSKIVIEDTSINNKTKFYTALYHCMIHPNIFNDVDGKYVGMDGKVHSADHNVYTVFSLWDTFRALHPLLALIDRERTVDFVKSMLLKYDEAGILPVWELAGNETWTMIGYHSVPVIVDAFMKGIRNYDLERAYVAVKHSAMADHQGLAYYKKMGYVPMDKSNDAVSRTLEYAYDDWCIAQMAKKLNKIDDYNYFIQRAQNYINVFDTVTKFTRGRKYNGTWRLNFDPMDASGLGAGEFTEGNSWQYTWFIPQDVNGLIDIMGGKEKFIKKLDLLFSTKIKDGYYVPSDMSGLIGQYAHGNEPSHHIAYLYNFTGSPWKSQKLIREIMDNLYTTDLNGYPGNEDCGQMSAWFIFSSLGFYPVTPGSNDYITGTPLFDKAVIKLGNGNKIKIHSERKSPQDFYVSYLSINGVKSTRSFLKYEEIRDGAEIKFSLTNKPDYNFGTSTFDIPKSEIKENFVRTEEYWLFPPFVNTKSILFNKAKRIELNCSSSDAIIRFTLDGSEVNENSQIYNSPLTITKSTTLRAKSYKAGFEPSEELNITYRRAINRSVDPLTQTEKDKYPLLKLKYNAAKEYTGTGYYNLLDGILGSSNFFDGYWSGFQEKDINATIDLGKNISLKYIAIRMLEQQGSWIFFPEKVEFYFSNDGKNWKPLEQDVYNEKIKPRDEGSIKLFGKNFDNLTTRYIRIVAKNIGRNPEWHSASGGKAWLFADEIIIEPREE